MAEGEESELEELREQAMTLEEEVAFLRRKLQDAPKRVRTLEERLLETKGQLAQAVAARSYSAGAAVCSAARSRSPRSRSLPGPRSMKASDTGSLMSMWTSR